MTKKIKLALVITKLEVGGAQQVVLTLARMLPRPHYELTLMTGREGEWLDAALHIPGLRIMTIPTLVRNISPLKDILAFGNIYRFFKQESFDVVHTHSSKAGLLGRWAAWMAGVPVIFHTIHGFPFHAFQPSWIRRFFIFLERSAATISHRLIVVTPADRDKGLREDIGTFAQYATIRAGIDLTGFSALEEGERTHLKTTLNIPSNHLVVGTIAVLKPQKAPLDFVKMAERVFRLRPEAPITFLYVGTGELEPEFRQAIRRSGLEGKFHWLGRWSRPLREFYGLLDLFVLTSLWEGLPSVLQEAQAMGVPVLATAVDGATEYLKDQETGWLAPPAQPDRMAERLLAVLDDHESRLRVSATAHVNLSKEFDQATMVEYYHQLFQKPIEG